MIAPALALAVLLSGSANELVEVKHPPVKLRVPAAWKARKVEGTTRYTAPNGDAYFLLDTGRTAAPMDAGTCRRKILDAQGVTESTPLSIGNAPAARFSALDRAEGEKEAVQTVTYLGCDGETTWSLVFHLVASKAGKLTPLAERIAKSVEYL